MYRRSLLLGTGIALSTSVAGCIDDGASVSDDPDDGDVDPSDDGNETPSDCEATDASDGIEDLPRVDEPPQSIGSPEGPDGEWNEAYLGACMATEPSLAFEVLTRAETVVDGGLQYDPGAPEEYWVALVASEGERDDLFDVQHGETREQIEAVDLEESVLVVVQSGWGSGSIEHRWARVEGIDEGLHLHGYETRPNGGTDDYTWRSSVLEVDRPAEAEIAHVSLTVSEERRITFDSTEGVVQVEE